MPRGDAYVFIDPSAVADAETGELPAGTFKSITDAIKAGTGGMPIVIPAGTFEETLLLEAGETLVGLKAARVLLADGPGDDLPAAPEGDEVEESVITGTSFHTISILGDGSLNGLTIRQRGPGKWFGVHCASGSTTITNCILDGATSSCLGVCGGASPTVSGCTIQRSFTGCGVCVFDGGLGTYEENVIRDNSFSGMEIGGEETSVTVGKNEIHSNHGDGILLYEGSTCALTANKIYRNWHCGVEVKDGAKLTAEENNIFANNFGVLIGRQANGQLTGNTINANFITGVDISKRNKDKEDEEAASKLVNNTINYNLEAGIKLWYDACVELDKNNITANMQEIKISPRSRRHVKYGEVGDEEGAEKGGAYGSNVVKELRDILFPTDMHTPVEEVAPEGGEEAETAEGGEGETAE